MKPLSQVDLTGKINNPQLAGPELYRAFRRAALEGISSIVSADGQTLALIVPDPGFPPGLAE